MLLRKVLLFPFVLFYLQPSKSNAVNEAESNIKKGMYETKQDKWDNTLFRKIQFKESATKLSVRGTTITKKGQATKEICDELSQGMKRSFEELTDFAEDDMSAFLFAPSKRRAIEDKKPAGIEDGEKEKEDEGKLALVKKGKKAPKAVGEVDGKSKESLVLVMLQSSLKTVNKNLGDLSTATVRLKKKKEARSLLEKMHEEHAALVAVKVQLEKLAFVDEPKVDVPGSKKAHNAAVALVTKLKETLKQAKAFH